MHSGKLLILLLTVLVFCADEGKNANKVIQLSSNSSIMPELEHILDTVFPELRKPGGGMAEIEKIIEELMGGSNADGVWDAQTLLMFIKSIIGNSVNENDLSDLPVDKIDQIIALIRVAAGDNWYPKYENKIRQAIVGDGGSKNKPTNDISEIEKIIKEALGEGSNTKTLIIVIETIVGSSGDKNDLSKLPIDKVMQIIDAIRAATGGKLDPKYEKKILEIFFEGGVSDDDTGKPTSGGKGDENVKGRADIAAIEKSIKSILKKGVKINSKTIRKIIDAIIKSNGGQIDPSNLSLEKIQEIINAIRNASGTKLNNENIKIIIAGIFKSVNKPTPKPETGTPGASGGDNKTKPSKRPPVGGENEGTVVNFDAKTIEKIIEAILNNVGSTSKPGSGSHGPGGDGTINWETYQMIIKAIIKSNGGQIDASKISLEKIQELINAIRKGSGGKLNNAGIKIIFAGIFADTKKPTPRIEAPPSNQFSCNVDSETQRQIKAILAIVAELAKAQLKNEIIFNKLANTFDQVDRIIGIFEKDDKNFKTNVITKIFKLYKVIT